MARFAVPDLVMADLCLLHRGHIQRNSIQPGKRFFARRHAGKYQVVRWGQSVARLPVSMYRLPSVHDNRCAGNERGRIRYQKSDNITYLVTFGRAAEHDTLPDGVHFDHP